MAQRELWPAAIAIALGAIMALSFSSICLLLTTLLMMNQNVDLSSEAVSDKSLELSKTGLADGMDPIASLKTRSLIVIAAIIMMSIVLITSILMSIFGSRVWRQFKKEKAEFEKMKARDFEKDSQMTIVIEEGIEIPHLEKDGHKSF